MPPSRPDFARPEFHSPRQAARILGVPERTVRRAVRPGVIRVLLRRTHPAVTTAELRGLLSTRRTGGDAR